ERLADGYWYKTPVSYGSKATAYYFDNPTLTNQGIFTPPTQLQVSYYYLQKAESWQLPGYAQAIPANTLIQVAVSADGKWIVFSQKAAEGDKFDKIITYSPGNLINNGVTTPAIFLTKGNDQYASSAWSYKDSFGWNDSTNKFKFSLTEVKIFYDYSTLTTGWTLPTGEIIPAGSTVQVAISADNSWVAISKLEGKKFTKVVTYSQGTLTLDDQTIPAIFVTEPAQAYATKAYTYTGSFGWNEVSNAFKFNLDTRVESYYYKDGYVYTVIEQGKETGIAYKALPSDKIHALEKIRDLIVKDRDITNFGTTLEKYYWDKQGNQYIEKSKAALSDSDAAIYGRIAVFDARDRLTQRYATGTVVPGEAEGTYEIKDSNLIEWINYIDNFAYRHLIQDQRVIVQKIFYDEKGKIALENGVEQRYALVALDKDQNKVIKVYLNQGLKTGEKVVINSEDGRPVTTI
ncbi:MAG: hypothetical protein AAB267_06320, partial [Candidatus Desantisbacteria bacterium]